MSLASDQRPNAVIPRMIDTGSGAAARRISRRRGGGEPARARRGPLEKTPVS
ncbi:hypothetical protein BDFB_013567 [Asbolus verrucosus]|uniref:Uncharacterized protein n=1 Tax=Asbolus verrucosus TaxID=1661398 RepID=A0A482VZ80_ASBVE|nr:hypothetical protein BDFB_013567 [Asbolus verrucosus]